MAPRERGRPGVGPQIKVRLTAETIERVDALAADEDMTRSAWIRRAVERARHRAQRDELVRALRRDDPDTWTYARLAASLCVTRELIAKIINPQR